MGYQSAIESKFISTITKAATGSSYVDDNKTTRTENGRLINRPNGRPKVGQRAAKRTAHGNLSAHVRRYQKASGRPNLLLPS